MQAKSNEQYWRDRYGLPPRVEARSVPRAIAIPRRRRRRLASLLKQRQVRFFPQTRAAKTRLAPSLLSIVAILAAVAIWMTNGNRIFSFGNDTAPKAAGAALAGNSPNPARSAAAGEMHLAAFAAAQETSLVALRGYLLTGRSGFKAEWIQAAATADTMQKAIEQDSRSWTEGGKLLQLSKMQKTATALRKEEMMLVGIIATPNQFPGLRVYREDIDPALVRVLAQLDAALQSVLLSDDAAMVKGVDLLAGLRGNIRSLRQNLFAYFSSSEMSPSIALQGALVEYRKAPALLATLRDVGSAQDRARIASLAAQLRATDKGLEQILALKRSPRWDYGDYAFKQKVLPLTENLLSTVAEWRAAS